MAADAPGPRILSAGLAEHGKVVAERVAVPALEPGSLDVLLQAKHRLERDNLQSLSIAALGEAGRHQGEGQRLLGGSHVDQEEAVALDGRVVPEVALVTLEGEGGDGALPGRERVDEAVG